MARRGRKLIAYPLLALLVLFAAAVVFARVKRHGHEPPEQIRAGVFRVRNFFTDLYGLRAGQKVLLFDAGVDPDGGALDALLDALHTNRDGVTDIYLTHGHFDHIAAAPLCRNARIHLAIQDADMAAQKRPMVPALPSLLSKVLPVPAVNITDAILDQAVVPLGDGRSLTMLPLPGHTPGSCLFLVDGLLFAGDSIQIEDGQLAFPRGAASVDLALCKRGIANLRAAVGAAPITQICTGHQGCTPGAEGQHLLDELIARAKKEGSSSP